MRHSFVQAMALAVSSFSFTLAFDSLSIPSTVAANTDVKLQITNDLSDGSSSFDGMFNSFRVYLSMSTPGWGSGPACYLVNSSAIATTDLTFQIPASVGPDASSYSVASMEFNQDPYADGPSGFEYSNDFTFTGGTGEWTKAELAGQTVGNPDEIPCSAYNCARNCSQTWFPANVNSTDAYRSTYECTAACPGVTYISWADAEATEGDDDSSPTGSATEVGTKSTTSGTASSTSKATTTASATASEVTYSITGKSSSASTSTTSTSKAATPSQSANAGSQTAAVGLTLLSSVLFCALVFSS